MPYKKKSGMSRVKKPAKPAKRNHLASVESELKKIGLDKNANTKPRTKLTEKTKSSILNATERPKRKTLKSLKEYLK